MPASIFSGNDVKLLKNILDFNGQGKIKAGSDDPTVTAQNLEAGSLYISSLTKKTYRKLDSGSSTNFIEVGSGGSGINYIVNYDAEANTTGYATYADAAASIPVDGTGGSANITFTRTTSTPLRGSGSFLITKDAANRQGEGVSYDFTIDAADKGKTLAIKFDMEASSAFVVGDSSDLRVFIYDITNATLIYPDSIKINSATGSYSANWVSSSSSSSYRLIFHVATTNASAWTVKLDNVKVGPSSEVYGPAASDWTEFTPVFSATTTAPTLGTNTKRAIWRREGDSIRIKYWHYATGAGTAGSGTYLFTLPNNLSADTTKVDVSTNDTGAGGTLLGTGKIAVTATNNATSSLFMNLYMYNSTNLYFVYKNAAGTDNIMNSGSGLNFSSSPSVLVFDVLIPISGWSTNVVAANSQVIRISNVLANGTRVTSDPVNLGEYRSLLRPANSFAFSDTNGTPDVLPTSQNGIRLYGGNAFSSADTNGQPTYYKIFVGKNKYVQFESFVSTGRTNPLPLLSSYDGSTEYGYSTTYDPSTGIAHIQAFRNRGGATEHSSGIDLTGAAVEDGYFDIIVSDNPVPVQSQLPRSQVRLYGGNGFGSTATATRRFTTTVQNIGTAITYTDSSTNGGTFTINENGIYSFSYSDWYTTNGRTFGLTLNAVGTELAGDGNLAYIVTGTSAQDGGGNGLIGNCSITLALSVGDVIRAQARGTGSLTDVNNTHTTFCATKVSN